MRKFDRFITRLSQKYDGDIFAYLKKEKERKNFFIVLSLLYLFKGFFLLLKAILAQSRHSPKITKFQTSILV